MKNIKTSAIVTVGIIIASIMLLSGCSDKAVNPSNDYVPGEVIIIWQDSVKYEFANSFIEQLKLETKRWDFDSTFAVWTLCDTGKEAVNLEILKGRKEVTKIYNNGPIYPDSPGKSIFIVHFDGSTSTDSASKFINSVKGLSVQSISVRSRYTLIKVPSGQEKLWVNLFKHYLFIKTAEVNTITHAT